MTKLTPVIVAVFSEPSDVLHAAEEAHKRGWRHLDIMTPYPIHGMEQALHLKMSWVPWVTLVTGLGGAALGFGFASWTSAVSWPINVGGKPLISWPAFIPIVFECGILIGGIATFVAVWRACRMPTTTPKIYDERFTDDKFGLIVPLHEGMKDSDVQAFLKGVGADEVRRVDA